MASKLAVIGTFFKRYDQSKECIKRVLESTRIPDEIIIICETQEDVDNLAEFKHPNLSVRAIETPKKDGKYAVIPYSYKINIALDETEAGLICYLDNGSMPHPDKYRQMAEALENNPAWQAVYCTQKRTGFVNRTHKAKYPIPDPYCLVNFTQAMHRPTEARWPLDMQYATPNDVADAMFFRDIGVPFFPVNAEMVLDEHHMESASASGL